MLRLAKSLLFLLVLMASTTVYAQGGPPMRTDDPGTPGNGNFEVNVALTSDRRIEEREFEAPLVDINYGLGDRLQLKFEVPFVVRGINEGPTRSGLGNSLVGVKWRFFENEEHEFRISTYPQFEFNNPTSSVDRQLAERGVRLLLPLEITKKLGPVDLNAEVGFSIPQYGSKEWLSGLAVGRNVTERLEIVGELYAVGTTDGTSREATIDAGMRYELQEHLIALVMVGRGLRWHGWDEPHFVGYGGLQFLFSAKTRHSDRAKTKRSGD